MPDFIGERYYSKAASISSSVCYYCFLYVCCWSNAWCRYCVFRFLEVDINTGVVVGMIIVLFIGFRGHEGDYLYSGSTILCIDFAFLVPAIFISIQMTESIPQLGFGSTK